MIVVWTILIFFNSVYSCQVTTWSETTNPPHHIRLNEDNQNSVLVILYNDGLYFFNSTTSTIIFSAEPKLLDAVVVDENIFYVTDSILIKRFPNGTEISCSTGEGSNLDCDEDSLDNPNHITIDPTGSFLIICDSSNHRVLKYEINTFPSGQFQILYELTENSYSTCSNPYNSSSFYLSTTNKIYLAFYDGSNKTHLAGNDLSSFEDNSIGTDASMNVIYSCEVRGQYLYFSGLNNNRIRRMNISYPYGVETIAGNGSSGNDNGDCSSATFNIPTGILFWNNSLLVSEFGNEVIRLITDPSFEEISVPPSPNPSSYIDTSSPLPNPSTINPSLCDIISFISSESCNFDDDISLYNGKWINGTFKINGTLNVLNFTLLNSVLTVNNFYIFEKFSISNSVIYIYGDLHFSNSTILTMGSGTHMSVSGCSFLSGTLYLDHFTGSKNSEEISLWKTGCMIGEFSFTYSNSENCDYSMKYFESQLFLISDCSSDSFFFNLALPVSIAAVVIVLIVVGVLLWRKIKKQIEDNRIKKKMDEIQSKPYTNHQIY